MAALLPTPAVLQQVWRKASATGNTESVSVGAMERSVGIKPAQRDQTPRIGERERNLLVAALAGEQGGVVAYRQLVALGYSSSAIARAVQAGRLHRVFRGVYAVGHVALTREGRWLSAVLACGPGAFVSRRSAGALLELRPNSRAVVDVTTTHRDRAGQPGIQLHGTTRLAAQEVMTVRGIPVTTVSRTLADLAAVLRTRDLERTFERAEALQVLDVRSVLESVHNRPGAPSVRQILGAWEPVRERSEMEIALRRLVVHSGLPRPEVNAIVGEFEVDLLWRQARLVAEADSLQFHLTRAAMERDRRRDALLAGLGYRVLRFTDRQVRRRPSEVIDALASVIGGVQSR